MYPVRFSRRGGRRRGARRLGVDERLRASAIPRRGGSKRAGRAHTKVGQGGAKRGHHQSEPNLPSSRLHGQRGGLTASTSKRKRSPCQQDGGHGDSVAGKIMRTSIPDLPEDILFHIHSLMPMREAARTACLSRAFLRSWRCLPKLIFNKGTIGLKSANGENFHHKITRVLRNYSGISLKTFEVDYSGICGFDGNSYLDSWLQVALKPGLEELTLWLFKISRIRRQYNFPCLLLSDGVLQSLRHLKLRCCSLHPTVKLGPLRSLTSLHLSSVSIKWHELECLLSNSLALEQLELLQCEEIICLKINCAMQRLNCLSIVDCWPMKVIESKAPNLSSLLVRRQSLDLSLVETLQMKKLLMECTVLDARVKLPSIMPNLETLVMESGHQVADAPMLPTKFLYLKHLTIRLQSGLDISRPFDYFSLVSFLDASPKLETFVLEVTQRHMIHESISGHPQHMPERRHLPQEREDRWFQLCEKLS